MPTHESPPSDVAPTLLATTEGDGLTIRLASDDDLVGTATEVVHETPGTHFDTPGRYQMTFESWNTTFELTMRYQETDGAAEAESLDFRLVEGHEWTVPLTVAIEEIQKR